MVGRSEEVNAPALYMRAPMSEALHGGNLTWQAMVFFLSLIEKLLRHDIFPLHLKIKHSLSFYIRLYRMYAVDEVSLNNPANNKTIK
jgi:hypothetical protein